jgi:hypothetical protein
MRVWNGFRWLFCERANETWGSIKGWTFIDQLSNYNLLKNSAPLSRLVSNNFESVLTNGVVRTWKSITVFSGTCYWTLSWVSCIWQHLHITFPKVFWSHGFISISPAQCVLLPSIQRCIHIGMNTNVNVYVSLFTLRPSLTKFHFGRRILVFWIWDFMKNPFWNVVIIRDYTVRREFMLKATQSVFMNMYPKIYLGLQVSV